MNERLTPAQRSVLNATTGDLDVLARLAEARREVGEIADALFHGKTSKKEERQQFARRLNGVKASLGTVEMHLGPNREDALRREEQRLGVALHEDIERDEDGNPDHEKEFLS